jgi:WD40 repeat protein/tRNA A-37 threonylcarbamoyl transferase component Bud32
MVDPEPEHTLDDETRERSRVAGSTDTLPSKTLPQAGNEEVPPESDGPDLPIVPRAVYEFGEEIARGGLGRIYRARDLRLDRVVAIKELLAPTRANQRRFLREIEVTVGLEHPNIVAIHEAGRWPDGQPFYSMNVVHGGTLEDAIEECHTLQQRLQLLPFVINVAEAVAYAHDKGVVHRDLKPANVLVGRFGETVVIDWGLARHPDGPEPSQRPPAPGHTRAGAVVGTPPYMPPEQARGEPVDKSADVYALGVMLYHLLSGRTPFSNVQPERVLDAIQRQTPAPLDVLVPDLAPDLLAIVQKAMAPDKGDRYPSARQMVDELRLFAAGRLVGAYSYSMGDLLLRFVRRHLAAVVTALVALVALVTLASYGVSTVRDERDTAQRHAEEANEERDRAEQRARALIVAEARALTDSDPTLAVSRLKHVSVPTRGAISVALQAQELGVAEAVLTGAGNQLACATFSPDGRLVAAAGENQEVRLWSLEGPDASRPFGDAEPRSLRAHSERISDCAFSPTGDVLASTGYDGQVILWRLSDATERLLPAPGGVMRALRFSSDGLRLAGVNADGTVRHWWLDGGRFEDRPGGAGRRPILDFFGAHAAVLVGPELERPIVWQPGDPTSSATLSLPDNITQVTAARSLDQERVLLGTQSGALFLWWPALAKVEPLGHLDGAVSDLDVATRDGAPLATLASMNGGVFVAGFDPFRLEALERHGERVSAVRLDRAGRHVASAGWDKAVHLVDLDTRSTRFLRGHRDVVSTVSFSTDGSRLLSGSWDNTLRLWPVRDELFAGRRVLRGHSVGVHGARFSPDGRHVVSGGHDDTVRIWNLQTGRELVLTGHTDHVFRVLYSHSGRFVASSSDDRTVRVWNAATGASERVLEGHSADVEELAFSPDDRFLLSGSEDATARLWQLDTGRSLELRHERAVTTVRFAADGSRFATASRSGDVRIYPVPSSLDQAPKPERTVNLGDEVWAMDFGPRGHWFAAADLKGTMQARELATGRSVVFDALPRAMVLRFSPDARFIAVASGDGRLVTCEPAHTECRQLHAGQSAIHALAFTPDSRLLFAAGGDAVVYTWDLETGEHRMLRGHRAPVFDLDVSADGTQVVSASADESVRLWPVRPLPRAENLGAFLDQLTRQTVSRAEAAEAGL